MSQLSSPSVFQTTYSVYLEEVDLLGVVYHVNYLKYLDRARIDYLLSLGFPVQTMITEQGINLIVSNVTIDYVRPAKMGDTIRARTWVETVRGASSIFAQELLNEDGSVCYVRAKVKLACVDATFKPVAIPKELKRGLESGY